MTSGRGTGGVGRGWFTRRRITIATVVVLCLLVFGFLYIYALGVYSKETNARTAIFVQEKPKANEYVSVQIKVIGADLPREDLELRMGVAPGGSLATELGELKTGLRVLVSSSTEGTDRTLEADKYTSPMDATIELAGVITDYPWDDHEGELDIGISKEGASDEWLPMQITFIGSLAGLDISAHAEGYEGVPNFQVVKIKVRRSPVTRAVVVFSILLLWMLTGTVVAMVIAVLLGNKIEMVMFPFIGTVLFSMVAFRNALPGAPPIGAVSDYMAFFWGYSFCVIALAALTITWLRRLPQNKLKEDA